MIAAGHSHSGCITESNPSRLFMWGSNPDCRLMTEENENKYLPSITLLENLRQDQEGNEPCFLALGVTHSSVITRSGELYTAGSKLDGQLGLKYHSSSQTHARDNSGAYEVMGGHNSAMMSQYRDPRELREIA